MRVLYVQLYNKILSILYLNVTHENNLFSYYDVTNITYEEIPLHILRQNLKKKKTSWLEDFAENLSYGTISAVRLGFLKTLSFYMYSVWLTFSRA